MTLENAIWAAAGAAGKLNTPAYVWQRAEGDYGYEVACVPYATLNKDERERAHTIVTPDGGVYEFQRAIVED